jgi:ABC-type transporter Mla subunit MlaD
MPTTIETAVDTALTRFGEVRTRVDAEARTRLDDARTRLGHVVDAGRKAADTVADRVPDVTEALDTVAPRVKSFVQDAVAKVSGRAATPEHEAAATNGQRQTD